jgi:hypothetical protein
MFLVKKGTTHHFRDAVRLDRIITATGFKGPFSLDQVKETKEVLSLEILDHIFPGTSFNK